MTLAIAALIAIALLQAADVATTIYALSRGLEEANPIVAKLFGRLSPAMLAIVSIALKILGTIPMGLLAWFYPAWWPVPALYAVSLAWVVRHNLREIRSARVGGG